MYIEEQSQRHAVAPQFHSSRQQESCTFQAGVSLSKTGVRALSTLTSEHNDARFISLLNLPGKCQPATNRFLVARHLILVACPRPACTTTAVCVRRRQAALQACDCKAKKGARCIHQKTPTTFSRERSSQFQHHSPAQDHPPLPPPPAVWSYGYGHA